MLIYFGQSNKIRLIHGFAKRIYRIIEKTDSLGKTHLRKIESYVYSPYTIFRVRKQPVSLDVSKMEKTVPVRLWKHWFRVCLLPLLVWWKYRAKLVQNILWIFWTKRSLNNREPCSSCYNNRPGVLHVFAGIYKVASVFSPCRSLTIVTPLYWVLPVSRDLKSDTRKCAWKGPVFTIENSLWHLTARVWM